MNKLPTDSPGDTEAEVFATSQAGISRRQLILGAAAIGATMAGMGVARRWWADGQTEALSPGPSPDAAFWAQQWDTPQGAKLAMQTFKGHPLLLNFWATWCPPCVDELPLINEFYRKNKANGWQVLGMAVDQLGPVQAFLKTHPLDFPIAMAGASGSALARSLGNMAGGLPFSVILGGDGGVLHRKLGRLTPANLDAWAQLK